MILHWPILTRPDHYQFPEAATILGINAMCLVYVAGSRYLRDLFADYPEAADTERVRVAPRRPSTPATSPGEEYYQRALAFAARQSLDEALLCFREAVMRDPKHVQAWNDCGKLLQQMGYPEEAKNVFVAAREAAENLGSTTGVG